MFYLKQGLHFGFVVVRTGKKIELPPRLWYIELMSSSPSKEEVMERFRKSGFIVLLIGCVFALILLGPSIKSMFANLFYKALQSDIQVMPTTIKEWARPDAVEIFSKELAECGFVQIGEFTINQSDRMKILAFMQPEKKIYAMVYDQYGKPALLDFYTFFEDGTSVRYTTAENPLRERPPGKQIWYVEEAMSIRELFDKMVQERPKKPILPVSKEGFAPALEKYMEEVSLWDSKNFMN